MYEWARRRMVEEVVARGIQDRRVVAALAAVPRHEFIEEALRQRAYEECSLPIGFGQTISNPYTVARMAEALELEGDERVLEVGTGCGYAAAILAHICANVYTIERISTLAFRARATLEAQGFYNVAVQVGDGSIGWRTEAPFDAIMVSAASPAPPRPLLSQLKEGGRLVVPVGDDRGQVLVRLKSESVNLYEETIGDCRFVPLRGRYGFARESM
jgi:protein-L-isoaspartate(D-aspartate) O-methyltransferase